MTDEELAAGGVIERALLGRQLKARVPCQAPSCADFDRLGLSFGIDFEITMGGI